MTPIRVDSQFQEIRKLPDQGELSGEQRLLVAAFIKNIYRLLQSSAYVGQLEEMIKVLSHKFSARTEDELSQQTKKVTSAFQSTTFFNLSSDLVSTIFSFLPPSDLVSCSRACRSTSTIIAEDVRLQRLISPYLIQRMKELSLISKADVIVDNIHGGQSIICLTTPALWTLLEYTPKAILNAYRLAVRCESQEVIDKLFEVLKQPTHLQQLFIYAEPPPVMKTLRIKPLETITPPSPKMTNPLQLELEILNTLLQVLMDLDISDSDKEEAIKCLSSAYKEPLLSNFWEIQHSSGKPDLTIVEQEVLENPSSPFFISSIKTRLTHLKTQIDLQSQSNEVALIPE